jgi:hypothetical protein
MVTFIRHCYVGCQIKAFTWLLCKACEDKDIYDKLRCKVLYEINCNVLLEKIGGREAEQFHESNAAMMKID